MFGIGLPEFILIMALALIVVGPDRLPGLAKTLAQHLMELKKTANSLRENFQQEMIDLEKPDNKNSEEKRAKLSPPPDSDQPGGNT